MDAGDDDLLAVAEDLDLVVAAVRRLNTADSFANGASVLNTNARFGANPVRRMSLPQPLANRSRSRASTAADASGWRISMSMVGVSLVRMPVLRHVRCSASHRAISSSVTLSLVCQPIMVGRLPVTGIGEKPAALSLSRMAVALLFSDMRGRPFSFLGTEPAGL